MSITKDKFSRYVQGVKLLMDYDILEVDETAVKTSRFPSYHNAIVLGVLDELNSLGWKSDELYGLPHYFYNWDFN